MNNSEVKFADTVQLVSITDLDGIITYANPAFCKIAGYALEELVGQNHNIVRHPYMPKAAFADLWTKIKRGDSWRGIVKNSCKNGDFYWVDAYVTPLYENDVLTGYQSVRTCPSENQKIKAQQLYDKINRGGSLRDTRANVSLKRLFATMIILFACLVDWIYVDSIISIITLLMTFILVFITFTEELVTFPNATEKIKLLFDSPSRLIYTGKGLTNIFNYPVELYKAKVSTILGRSSDSGRVLVDLASELEKVSSEMLEGVNEENAHLAQFATAITQMSTTIDEVRSNTNDTHDRVLNIQNEM